LSITEPSDGARYQVGDLVKIRSQVHASDGAAELTVLVNGQALRIDRPDVPLQSGTMLQPWQPSEPGTYTIQIRMTTASGAALESGTVTIEVGAGEVELASPTPTAEAAIPTFTPTPVLGPPITTADQNAFCRLGPSQAYGATGELLAGESSPISGRNVDSTWWVIAAGYGGEACWISDSVVTVSGDVSGVPVVEAPPLPPPTPTPLSPSGLQPCTSSVELTWSAVDHPNGIAFYEWQVDGPSGTQTGQITSTSVEYIVACGGADYQWRVRAVENGGAAGQYSEFMSFEVQ
jgi:hypothetical protein